MSRLLTVPVPADSGCQCRSVGRPRAGPARQVTSLAPDGPAAGGGFVAPRSRTVGKALPCQLEPLKNAGGETNKPCCHVATFIVAERTHNEAEVRCWLNTNHPHSALTIEDVAVSHRMSKRPAANPPGPGRSPSRGRRARARRRVARFRTSSMGPRCGSGSTGAQNVLQ